ncbi:MAG: histidine kinase [Erythrobacter sp. SCN 62-14]|nr:MAG: histidine kinase [Erythrobacter sp. SCN 62-14]
MAIFTPEPGAAPVRASVPFRTVLLSMVALWATYFLLVSIRGLVMDFGLQYELAWRRGLVSVIGVGLTIVLWLLLRLFDRKTLAVKIGAATVLAMPVAMVIGQINQWVFEDIQQRQEQAYAQKYNLNLRRDEAGNLLVDVPVRRISPAQDNSQPTEEVVGQESVIIAPADAQADFWRRFLEVALGRYFLLLAWATTYFALLAGVQAREAERREEQFRSAAKAAELRSLRYQVNPHFLFNTLNSLSALVMTGKADRAEAMIQTMSRFYRHSLADELTNDVALRDEFDLQRLYLDIEAVRFPDRLRCVFDLPPALADARVPGMILQPLVENSVKYAVSAVTRPVTITVSAREELGELVITVSDDGPGLPKGSEHGLGIGLANVRDRLQARFGPSVGFASGAANGGYRTEIRIPLTCIEAGHGK